MKLGVSIPHAGHLATPENIVKVAQRAEALGFDSVWAFERLLAPTNPRTPYAGTPDGKLPLAMKRILDPLTTLTFVAANTSKIRLGVSVLNIPFYNPVLLARQLTAMDIFSNGRLQIGMGLGWSEDEFEATGADMKTRGARADEFLECLKAIWTTDPASYKGKFFSLPESTIQPKPVQQPHPPIYLAAFDPRAMNRVAKYADGWNPVALPVEAMQQMIAGIRQMAQAAGRDGSKLAFVVRANVYVAKQAISKDRGIFTGTWEQIAEDVQATKALGATELFFDVTFDPSGKTLEDYLALVEKCRTLGN